MILGDAGSPGLPYILPWPPEISAGSPKMNWYMGSYKQHFEVVFENVSALPGKNNLISSPGAVLQDILSQPCTAYSSMSYVRYEDGGSNAS